MTYTVEELKNLLGGLPGDMEVVVHNTFFGGENEYASQTEGMIFYRSLSVYRMDSVLTEEKNFEYPKPGSEEYQVVLVLR